VDALELAPDPGPGERTAAIYGKDDRSAEPRIYPWVTIGKLTTDDGEECTAALVGACYALTAGHCVVDEASGKAYAGKKLHFASGSLASGIDALAFGYEYSKSQTRDWAIVHLREPLGRKLGWMGVKKVSGNEIDPEQGYIVAGYNFDLFAGKKLTADKDVDILFRDEAEPDLIYHDANSAPGSSGAPVFYMDKNGRPWIVAVNTTAVVQQDGSQLHVDGPPTSPTVLATAMATDQFFGSLRRFLASHPCR
jgi:protease YdgD